MVAKKSPADKKPQNQQQRAINSLLDKAKVATHTDPYVNNAKSMRSLLVYRASDACKKALHTHTHTHIRATMHANGDCSCCLDAGANQVLIAAHAREHAVRWPLMLHTGTSGGASAARLLCMWVWRAAARLAHMT